ncbi:hypothetical protein AMJ49_03500 [Parcubacteria bacterium DG_74_2]|nr:MAG: hypothetical protein AMJ49_03500 [Parcubacteria bacterium DG_74_2]
MAKLNFLKGNYEIIEKPENLSKISSRTHPDQNKWYKENTLNLQWDLIEGAEYSFILSKDALAQPDEILDEPRGEVEYKNLEDGIYYFHLRQAEKEEGQELKWGLKTTFRTMIDGTIPEEFELQTTEIEGKNYLVFATVDKTSGIEYYRILETRDKQQENWEIGESPYLLKDQTLKSKILVKAVDKAGNERIEEISPPPQISWKDLLPAIILGLVIVGIIFWLIKKFRFQNLKIKSEDY